MERLVDTFKSIGIISYSLSGNLEDDSKEVAKNCIKEVTGYLSSTITYSRGNIFYTNYYTFTVTDIGFGTFKVEQWETF